MPERRTYLRSVAAVATGITLAGCSGDGSDGSDGTGDGSDGDSTPTATTTPAMDATTVGSGTSARDEYPDYNWAQLEEVRTEDATTVEITGFSYDPLVARVPAGEAIPFPNADSVPHTVTAPAASVDVTVQPGEEGSVTIDEPGIYDYVCRFHPPEMLGRLVVEDGLTVEANTPADSSTGTATPERTSTGSGGGPY